MQCNQPDLYSLITWVLGGRDGVSIWWLIRKGPSARWVNTNPVTPLGKVCLKSCLPKGVDLRGGPALPIIPATTETSHFVVQLGKSYELLCPYCCWQWRIRGGLGCPVPPPPPPRPGNMMITRKSDMQNTTALTCVPHPRLIPILDTPLAGRAFHSENPVTSAISGLFWGSANFKI